MPKRLDIQTQARRVAREFNAGEVVALGPGMPCSVPTIVPSDAAIQFLADSGALGYGVGVDRESNGQGEFVLDSGGQMSLIKAGGTFLSTVDLAAMIRSGQVSTAVIQPGWVTPTGDFSLWTTVATPGLPSVGAAVDLAGGARRVVAMMGHTGPDGRSNIVDPGPFPPDGASCVGLIVTDVAVLRVEAGGFGVRRGGPRLAGR